MAGPAPNMRMKLGAHNVIWKDHKTIIKHGFKFRSGNNLVPLQYKSQLHEGLELEKDGAWFEIFLYDHIRKLYAVERTA